MPTIPLILSSEFGQNLSSDYSSFSQQFSPPISIPRDTAPRIRLYQASIPYVMPNVTTGVNDSLTVERKTGNTVHSTATLVLDQGLYSLADIQERIDFFCTNNTHDDLTVELTGVVATQRVNLSVKNTSYDYNFKFATTTNSFAAILGFTADHAFLTASSPSIVRSETTAAFDTTTSVQVLTSLSAGLYLHGNQGSPCVASIPLAEATPGQVFSYRPVNLLEIEAPHLQGATISSTTISLQSQSGARLNLMNEYFQLTLEIVY